MLFQVTYDFMFLQGMPDIRKDDPKKFLDVLHVSSLLYIPVSCVQIVVVIIIIMNFSQAILCRFIFHGSSLKPSTKCPPPQRRLISLLNSSYFFNFSSFFSCTRTSPDVAKSMIKYFSLDCLLPLRQDILF